MARSLRFTGLAYIALVSAAVAAVAVGCAESTSPDGFDDEGTDASADSSRRDARPSDTDDAALDEDSGPEPKDAAVKDAPSDGAKLDAGKDADASADADAGKDAAADAEAGADGGDAGDAGDASMGGTKPLQGEVVISEVMFNPSAATELNGEWIELYNTTASPKLLSGLILEDGSNRTHTLRAGLVIAPGAYVVLVSRQAGAVDAMIPAAAIVYDYATGVAQNDAVQLANSATGSIVLRDGVTPIARGEYGPLGLTSPTVNGASVQLKALDYASAGVKANWCSSPNAWAVGSDKGTPGAASDCPP